MIRSILFTLIFVLSSIAVVAQDTVQLSFRISNNEFDSLFQGLISTEYTQGGTATADLRLVKKDGIRVGLSGQYARKSFGTPFDFYGAGPSVSVDAGKYFTVRGAAHFGVVTTYNDDGVFTRRYEIGPRINLGKHLFVDPLVFTFTKSESLSVAERGFEFGGGLRF